MVKVLCVAYASGSFGYGTPFEMSWQNIEAETLVFHKLFQNFTNIGLRVAFCTIFIIFLFLFVTLLSIFICGNPQDGLPIGTVRDTCFQSGIFYMSTSTTWDQRFYFPSEGKHVRILSPWTARLGLNPHPRVYESNM